MIFPCFHPRNFRIVKSIRLFKNIPITMYDTPDVPTRYLLPNGKYESINSYNTFINYYVPTDPTPTATELATLSGFTVSTCRTWITKNKFISRKKEFTKQQKEKENISMREINESIISMLAALKMDQTLSHKEAVDDVKNRLEYINTMETLDPERIELLNEHSNLLKAFNNLITALWNTDKYDDYLREENYNPEDIQLLLEELETIREKEAPQVLKQLEEEYKNVEW